MQLAQQNFTVVAAYYHLLTLRMNDGCVGGEAFSVQRCNCLNPFYRVVLCLSAYATVVLLQAYCCDVGADLHAIVIRLFLVEVLHAGETH
ncbi:unnamed protein product [Sphagnum jensenii]